MPINTSQDEAALLLTEKANGVWRDGALLVMRAGGTVPRRCVYCNAPAATQVKRKVDQDVTKLKGLARYQLDEAEPIWTRAPFGAWLAVVAAVWARFLVHPVVGIFTSMGALGLSSNDMWGTHVGQGVALPTEFGVCQIHRNRLKWWPIAECAAIFILFTTCLSMSPKGDEGIIERSWSFTIAATTIHATAFHCWVCARLQRFRPLAIRKENGHHWVRGCGKPFLDSLPVWL